jgi:hypothetical protein
MLTTTNGRSIVDGLETIGRDGFQVSREGLQSLGREGLHVGREGLQSLGREGLHVGREGLQAGREGLQSLGREGLHVGRDRLHVIGSSVADLAETFPLRPKRRRSFPLIRIIAVALVGAAVVALVARLIARRDGIDRLMHQSAAEHRFDHDAVSRAADEGMGTAIGASVADDLVGGSEDPDSLPDYTGLPQTVSV